jgi:hypothetical protein
MELTAAHPPYEELVNWACQFIDDLHLPADRPWYLASPPLRQVPTWEYRCHCRRWAVRVKRYACVGGKGSIYLGQCPRCQTLIWSFLAALPARRSDPMTNIIGR